MVDKEQVPYKSKTKEQLEEDMEDAKAELSITEEGISQYLVRSAFFFLVVMGDCHR